MSHTLKFNKILNLINNTGNNLQTHNLTELCVKTLAGALLFPYGIKIVPTNHVLTFYTLGKYDGYRTEGLRWINPISKYNLTPLCDLTINNQQMHLTDSQSNPLVVDTFVIYNIVNPINYHININGKNVLNNWIESFIRQIITQYSYNELTNNDNKDLLSNMIINKINRDPMAKFYGIEIKTGGLLQINYAKEIAETMLVKQKAKATIEARKELVDATINLINDIGTKLETKLTSEDKSKLITCLTVSMIGNNSPSQVINLN